EAATDENPEFSSQSYRFRYTSLTTPDSVFEYGVKDKKLTLLKQSPVLGGFDRDHYQSERVEATAADGTHIPISLVYRKGARDHGAAPLLLTAYGSYGASQPVTFSHARVSLLDRGVVFAIAHIRGGGELGKVWHDAGRMMKKKNTFTDFIACAEH